MTFFAPQTQLDGYRGSYIDAFKARAPVTMYILSRRIRLR